MTSLVWATMALCLLAILIVVGIPYWITFMRRRNKPDHAGAHAYLDAKTGMDECAIPDQPGPDSRQTSTGTAPVGQPRRTNEPG
ncbi:MAG TPA: hypothetical protein VEC76_16310 [Streptosporangiaceae bacterium]|nr:hypothetical protein [Streptosporangiaceae bacterium]